MNESDNSDTRHRTQDSDQTVRVPVPVCRRLLSEAKGPGSRKGLPGTYQKTFDVKAAEGWWMDGWMEISWVWCGIANGSGRKIDHSDEVWFG